MEKVRKEVMELLQWLVKRIEQDLTLNSLVLFGSYARGEERPESDLDIVIISQSFPKKFTKRFDVLRPFLKEAKLHPAYKELRRRGFYPQFSPIPYKPEDLERTPPLLLDLVEDGIIIKDDNTFSRKMDELRKKLKELGARRLKTSKGNRYWILKPKMRKGEVIEI